jgi:hypothetical protein
LSPALYRGRCQNAIRHVPGRFSVLRSHASCGEVALWGIAELSPISCQPPVENE